jgi:hypothetical protein
MKDKKNTNLKKLESWDTSKVEVRQPRKTSRVVFSVAFNLDDFELISKYAQFCGIKTSKFISGAAIEKATGQGELLFRGSTQGAHWTIGEEKIGDTAKHQDLILTLQSY